MSSLGTVLTKKATRATIRHSVRGIASKAQRQPFRSATLLGIGGLIGAATGWLAGRKAGSGEDG
jgi:hypothetical protein